MGLPEDVTGALAAQVWGWTPRASQDDHAAELNLNLRDRRLRLTLDLARELIGFPRHLGQHPGGFVLTQDRLDDLVPIEPAAMENRQVIEWDKDDIDALRFMKVDVLGLGMLGCLRRAFDLLEHHRGQRSTLAGIPPEDPATYEMIQQRRHARHVPDRKPGADGDAAPAEAAHLLRSGHRGGDRPPRPDPGRHGASLSAPARGQRAGRLSDTGAGARAGQDAGRAAVPGTGDAGGDRLRRLFRRAKPTSCAAPWRRSKSPAGSAISRTS